MTRPRRARGGRRRWTRIPAAALLAWPALARGREPVATLAPGDERLAGRPRDAALHYLRGRVLHLAGRAAGGAGGAARRALELDATGEVTLAMRDLLRDAAAARARRSWPRATTSCVAALLRQRPRSCAARAAGAEAPTRQWRCRRCGAFDSFARPPAPGTCAARRGADACAVRIGGRSTP